MKTIYYLMLFLLFIQCSNVDKMSNAIYSSSMEADTHLFSQILEKLSKEKNLPSGELVVKVGNLFLDTPYVANTLETDGDERLVINLREMDCTTFAETCLALVRTIQSKKPGIEKYLDELTKIRYRGAKINGYASRLHYTSDWIFDNEQKNLIQDVSKDIANTPYHKTINFMSTHPDSYQQLKGNKELIDKIAGIESEISKRPHFYIPKDQVAALESNLNEGDIIALTTSIDGLDVSHMGILVHKNNRIHLLHASTFAKKVVVSEEPLHDYLQKSKLVTGIIVARPL